MAIRSGFFNSVNGDRKYDARRFAEYFASFIGNGVFPNPSDGLQVIANNDMTVTVKAGKAWINGYILINDDDYVLQLDPADGVLHRIDRVVARYDVEDREIRIEVKKGAFSSAPVPPALQRDADAYELALADIYVRAGAVNIIQDNITDLRGNKELCGRVDSLIAGDVPTLAALLDSHLQNKGNPHAVTAAQVGAAPASHVGSGGSAHALATTSAAGFMSAEDKIKLNQLRSVDETVYGSVTYTDTVAAGSTLRKTIAIGSGKTEGKAVITSWDNGVDGVLVFFTTNATRTYAVGGAYTSGESRSGGALRQDIAGFVTSGGSTLAVGVGGWALGDHRIGIINMYISGSSIIIDFYNRDTSPRKLNCTIAWEVR